MKIFLQNPHLFEYYVTILVLLSLFAASFFIKKMLICQKWLGIGLIVAPVAYFFILLDAHVVNIPYTDDFNLLETIDKFLASNSLMEKLKLLFEQVNQHRFGFERLVMLAMYACTGTVNIKVQIIIGNLFLLGIAYMLFWSFSKEKISWYVFIPVPYILFNLVYFENAYWGIAALQNTPLIFFAFLTAYGLARDDLRGFRLAIVAALLTTFTSGSGLLTWIIGAPILLFQKHFPRLIWWLAIATAVVLFYFLFDYEFISSPGEKVWVHPKFNTSYLLAFWGNALYMDIRHPLGPGFRNDITACVLLGLAIAVIFSYSAIKTLLAEQYARTNWFILGAMMFIMGTGVMLVISRPISQYIMHGGNVFSRRYMTFGVVLVALCYTCLLVSFKQRTRWINSIATISFLCFATLNFVSYYSSIANVRTLHDELMIDGYFWKNYKTFLTTGDQFGDIPFWNHPTRMHNLINNLEAKKLTRFYQNNDIPEHRKLMHMNGSQKNQFAGYFDAVFMHRYGEGKKHSKYYKFVVSAKDPFTQPNYFVLKSTDRSIPLPATPVPNTFSDFLKTGSYYSNSYQYTVYKTKLPKGTYSVEIMSRPTGKWQSANTGKKVQIH